MSALFIVGGPLAVPLIAFSLWSGILVFGDIDGIEHKAGTQPGGTFVLTVEPTTGFTEIEGLGLETELDPIEYREGDEITTVRKLNGLKKYTNITIRRPTGFNRSNWKFVFDETGLPQERMETKLDPVLDEDPDAGTGMIEIEPPTLVIPVR